MLNDYINTVNKLLGELHIEDIDALASPDDQRATRERQAELLRLREYLLQQRALTVLPPDGIGDIFDLPDELINQLTIKKPNALELQIIQVMRSFGRDKFITLDQILVGLYRAFESIHER